MVRVEREVVQIEEPKPMSFSDGCVTTDSIILISDPDDQNDVESRCGVVKEL